ncbi:LysE family translocator [Streptosporangium carneum]|uniref:Lysine transporter LysE n=1 Tax=Streptosporangium carneum TaxID=47481 RepID=A0A9W6IBF9_9ACTN|nr:LysE family translocator [Streptosporangium carneum]GLK15093.1 lysine transporter LysE [Streptosporangium carneum]
MASVSAFVGITVVALGMVLTPGPNMIYLVSRSVTQGRGAGLVSLAGIAAGFLTYLVATAAGIAAIFAVVPVVYTGIKLAGAAYLLWLAWKAVRPGGGSVFAPGVLPVDPPRRLFSMGLITSLLNPKIAILYVSVLPQFVDPARGDVVWQSLSLGLVQTAVSLSVNAVIVLTAGSIASFLARRPLWARVQRYLMATVLAWIALRIATDRSRVLVSAS